MLRPELKPARYISNDRQAGSAQGRLRLLFILGALPAALVALLAPKTIALPLASLLSIMIAFGVATYAWRANVNYKSKGLTFWDLAGMLAFVGFGAGAMADPQTALELFGINATK